MRQKETLQVKSNNPNIIVNAVQSQKPNSASETLYFYSVSISEYLNVDVPHASITFIDPSTGQKETISVSYDSRTPHQISYEKQKSALLVDTTINTNPVNDSSNLFSWLLIIVISAITGFLLIKMANFGTQPHQRPLNHSGISSPNNSWNNSSWNPNQTFAHSPKSPFKKDY
jgi:hypothetical protein